MQLTAEIVMIYMIAKPRGISPCDNLQQMERVADFLLNGHIVRAIGENQNSPWLGLEKNPF